MIKCLYLMPTLKCNCCCKYCYLPEHQYSSVLREDDYYYLIDKFKYYITNHFPLYKQVQLRFTGGEPYLAYPLLGKLTNYFLTQFPKGRVTINTNGTLINEQNLDIFHHQLNSSLIHVLSLDSTEKIHNRRRPLKSGENSFNSTIQGLNVLKRANYPAYINCVVDRQTYNNIEEFLQFIKFKLGLSDLSISLLQNRDFPLTRQTKLNFLVGIYKLAHKYDIRISGHHRLLLGQIIPGLKCRAGESTLVVTEEGFGYPCQRFVGTKHFIPIPVSQLDFSKTYDFTNLESLCYSPDNLWLGEKLFELYEKYYPDYRTVNELDRILFGVIS